MECTSTHIEIYKIKATKMELMYSFQELDESEKANFGSVEAQKGAAGVLFAQDANDIETLEEGKAGQGIETGSKRPKIE